MVHEASFVVYPLNSIYGSVSFGVNRASFLQRTREVSQEANGHIGSSPVEVKCTSEFEEVLHDNHPLVPDHPPRDHGSSPFLWSGYEPWFYRLARARQVRGVLLVHRRLECCLLLPLQLPLLLQLLLLSLPLWLQQLIGLLGLRGLGYRLAQYEI